MDNQRMVSDSDKSGKAPLFKPKSSTGRPVQRAQDFPSWCAYYPAHIKNKAAFLTRENGIPKPFGTLIYLLSLRRRKNKSQQARKMSSPFEKIKMNAMRFIGRVQDIPEKIPDARGCGV